MTARCCGVGFALAAGLALPASGAAQPSPTPAASPPRPRAVQVMTLESPAWVDGGEIPPVHSQAGRDVSPPLVWRGAPDGTVSFVLVVRDLDTVPPGGGDEFLHWLVWNIPGAAASLDQGIPPGNATPGGRRQISATGPTYRGPAAPASGPPHHYVFELYALDTAIDVPAVGQPPTVTRAAVMSAMAGHVRGKGVLTGRYRRPTPSPRRRATARRARRRTYG